MKLRKFIKKKRLIWKLENDLCDQIDTYDIFLNRNLFDEANDYELKYMKPTIKALSKLRKL